MKIRINPNKNNDKINQKNKRRQSQLKYIDSLKSNNTNINSLFRGCNKVRNYIIKKRNFSLKNNENLMLYIWSNINNINAN